jgi:hypothetical protein
MAPEQLVRTLVRFPHVLGYDVKGHLRPHLAYLASLGVEQEQLQDLVLCRPQVLGPGIEKLVYWLTLYFQVPRKLVGRLLRTYPFDYQIKVRIAKEEEEQEEKEEEERKE